MTDVMTELRKSTVQVPMGIRPIPPHRVEESTVAAVIAILARFNGRDAGDNTDLRDWALQLIHVARS